MTSARSRYDSTNLARFNKLEGDRKFVSAHELVAFFRLTVWHRRFSIRRLDQLGWKKLYDGYSPNDEALSIKE